MEPEERERCQHHEKQIDRLIEHGQNQGQIVTALERDLAAVCRMIPDNFGQWMGEVTERLKTVGLGLTDISTILGTHSARFATKGELEAVRAAQANFVTKEQFKPIHGAFWGFVKGVGFALMASLLTLLGWTQLAHK